MLLQGGKEFRVLFFSAGSVCGARFRLRKDRWELAACGTELLSAENPSAGWEKVLQHLGGSKDTPLFLSGALEKGLFFRFSSFPLAAREQRSAVEMELPRRLLIPLPDPQIQFHECAPAPDGTVQVGVYVFPAASLEYLAARLTQCSCRADLFIHPLLALKAEDPGIVLEELDPDYFFDGASWQPRQGNEERQQELDSFWEKEFSGCFTLPGDADFCRTYRGVLLVARGIVRNLFRNPAGLQVLPEKLRLVRYRKHLCVSALLLFLLALNGVWYFVNTRGAEYREYRLLKEENNRLKARAESIRNRLKRSAKSTKDIQKVLSAESAGEPDLMLQLARLAQVLPSNVLVNSLRYSDSGMEIVLQTEDSGVNLSALVSQLGLWKVSQLQQRQFGDSAVATLVMRLTPLNGGDNAK